MSSDAKNTEKEKSKKNNPKKLRCGIAGPGPKYKLKTLVGYDDHCHSKLRNPAYSVAFKQTGGTTAFGPGPKYFAALSRKPGFSLGFRMDSKVVSCTPGPYSYDIPNCSPKYTIKSRTSVRRGNETPAPYFIPDKIFGPAFTMAMRPSGVRCSNTPGPSRPFKIDLLKPRSPAFSLGDRQTQNYICQGPGPIYFPKLIQKAPYYSFGTKHSECSPPLITECDDKC